jgi:hypothetical protein
MLFPSDDGSGNAAMGDQTDKRTRGRAPKHVEAMSGADRQSIYVKAWQCDALTCPRWHLR